MILFRALQFLPTQLILVIVLSLFLAPYLSHFWISLGYSLSTSMTDILLFVLPVIVFGLMAQSVAHISKKSLGFLAFIFIAVTASNMLALFISYGVSHLTLPLIQLTPGDHVVLPLSTVQSLWNIDLPQWCYTNQAMIAGLILGILTHYLPNTNLQDKAKRHIHSLNRAIRFFLSRIFIPLVPIYVWGFCAKLSFDQSLMHLFAQYGKIFIVVLIFVWLYILLVYVVGANGSIQKAFQYIRAMGPAGLMGFSTMSSAATLPVTLQCIEAIAPNRDIADLTISSTANIHMLGDDLMLIILSLSLASVFGLSWPDLQTFIPFMWAFSIAKLSCVGVPGASVLVVLPVLSQYFHFTPEMISLVTTIYILQDSFGTAANVMGNGAFAMVIQRAYLLFLRK